MPCIDLCTICGGLRERLLHFEAIKNIKCVLNKNLRRHTSISVNLCICSIRREENRNVTRQGNLEKLIWKQKTGSS